MIKILQYPDPILLNKSSEITDLDELAIICKFLVDASKEIECLGIAAPQIGFNKQIAYICSSHFFEEPFFIINPVIEYSSEDGSNSFEGCLSLNKFCLVWAPNKISVQFYSSIENFKNNIKTTQSLEGMQARIFMHEYNHLQGKLINEA